ncbi:MAG: transposase [Thermomicrobiales bacterium]
MNPRPRRTNLRLRAFDYHAPGPYFVTISLHQRQPRFGIVENERVVLSPAGKMIADAWVAIARRFDVTLDASIVIPDHMHGILTLPLVADSELAPALAEVVGAFKGLTTKLYRDGVASQGWPRFQKYFWGENYYEHIIRDVWDMDAKRLYIERNPWRWEAKRRAGEGWFRDRTSTGRP